MTPTNLFNFPRPWHGVWPSLFWILMAIIACIIWRRQPVLALAAVRGRRSLAKRIAHILDRRVRQPILGRRWTALVTLLVGILAAGLALAQSRPVAVTGKSPVEKKPPPAASSAPAAEPPVVFTGRVLDRDDKPVVDADVAVIIWPTFSGGFVRGKLLGAESIGHSKTDKHGRFRLSVPRPAHADEAAIVARAAGTGPGWSVMEVKNPKADVVIHVQPQRSCRLRLVDLQGQPAAGVKLYVARLGKAAWRWRLDGHEFNGYDGGDATALSWLRTFSQPDVRAKAEQILAWPGSATTNKDGRLTLQRVGRDQGIGLLVSDDRFALQVLDIKPQSDEKEEEITLTLAPPRLVEGKITDSESGRPVAQARLHVTTNCIGCHAVPFPLFAGTGAADWKGRRGFAHEIAFPSSIFLGVDGGTDAKGLFRLNPFPKNGLLIGILAPPGEPYLGVQRTVVWPKGATRKELNVALPRAVKVRGKVTEASGQPVAGARVDYWSKSVKLPEGALPPAPARTAVDGTFEMVVPAGKGHLLINAAAGNFVREPIAVEQLSNERLEDKKPPEEAGPKTEGRPSFYPDAWAAIGLKAGGKPYELNVTLRRKPAK